MSNVISAQVATNTEQDDSTNIYHQAVSVFCMNMHNKTESLLVEQNNLTTNSLPDKIADHDITIVDLTGLKKLLKKNKGGQVELARVVPLRVEDGEFFVSIIFFEVSTKKGQFYFTNKGGYSVVFNYNAEDRQFVYKEIR